MPFQGLAAGVLASAGELLFEIRPVLFANGLLLLILACFMGIPLVVDLAVAGGESRAFAAAIAVTLFMGGVLVLSGQGLSRFGLKGRQAFLFSASAIPFAALFAALPLAIASHPLSVTDALFEAISGLTTTGATVMTGLDQTAPAILLWRALLQWLGGAGVAAAALLLLPLLRIGGMQIFLVENSVKTGGMPTKLPRMVAKLLLLYFGLTILLAAALMQVGMSPLEAVCHAMSSLSTGGFSTSDQSLAKFSDAARWLCVFGMIGGGLNLSLLVSPWRGKRWRILKDSQIRWYLFTLLGFSLLLTFWYWAAENHLPGAALRKAVFQAVSILTTTGFRLDDDRDWGGFAHVAIFTMSFIGGCTGSAAGGIKVFRFEVLFAITRQHISRILYPHGVFEITFNRLRLPDIVLRSVLSFFMLYFCCFAAIATGLAVVGLDPLSSLSASAAMLGNIGAGIGPIAGAAGGYHALPVAAKGLLALGMLLGRLELAPLLLLFLPSFWKD